MQRHVPRTSLSDTGSSHVLHVCSTRQLHDRVSVQVSDVQDSQLHHEIGEATFSECLKHAHLVNTIATDWRPKTVGTYRGLVCVASYPWAERPRLGTQSLQIVTWERMIIMERMDGARASCFCRVTYCHRPAPRARCSPSMCFMCARTHALTAVWQDRLAGI